MTGFGGQVSHSGDVFIAHAVQLEHSLSCTARLHTIETVPRDDAR